ncbi:MAG TPA: amino acid permease [Blastocatellia bacterium]|nr:amino acid permease [Blastocatellia bacterium]
MFSAIAVLIGSTIGSGIFRSPAGIAAKVPDETLYITLWCLGGFFSLCGALSLSELAAGLPHTGGVFVYLREGFGKLVAFLFGWAELTIIRASALGAISMVFGEYLVRVVGQNSAEAISRFFGSGTRLLGIAEPSPARCIAICAILVVAIFNIFGVSLGALVQNLTTTTKYGALIILVAAAFLIGGNNPAPVHEQATHFSEGPLLVRFGLAFIALLWVYDGWADVTFVSGEVKNPQRNLPVAIIAGTLGVIAIYLLVNFAYLHLLDVRYIAGSKLVAADAASRIIGGSGELLISIAVMISAFGTLNGSMLTGPRIFFAMADDGLFFKRIASVHPRFKSPYVAIILATGLAIIFVSLQNFEQLADAFVLGIWPFYALAAVAVYILRRKRPDMPRPYRTVGYPVTPALFVGAVLLLLGNALLNDIRYYAAKMSGGPNPFEWSGALMVFAVVVAGIPAYYIWRHFSPDSQIEPESKDAL